MVSAIKQMEELANRIPGVISLSQGIPSFPTDDVIRESVIKAITHNKVDKYSEVAGLYELRKLISMKLAGDGMSYSEDEIVVTAGAMQALSAAIFALTRPGQEIIVFSPTYSYYERIAKLVSVQTKHFLLDEKNDWKVDIAKLEKCITKKTKLLVLCNPNNPTGSVLSRKELVEIGLLAQKYNFTIISDDVYHSLYFNKERLFSLCEEEGFKKNVVRIVSLSKDFSLTGWRIGYLHADKSLITQILDAHDVLINCAPVVSQYAALGALENYERIVSKSLSEYTQNRMLMGEKLEQMRDHVDFVWPEGTYYFFPRIKVIRDSVKFSLDLLHKYKVSVVPGSEFGIGGEGHIRLCFGKSKEEIFIGMNRLRQYFVYNTYVQV